MGVIDLFEHLGEDGGTWFAASYPLGATRYYNSPEARTAAVEAYCAAIRSTGGYVGTVERVGATRG